MKLVRLIQYPDAIAPLLCPRSEIVRRYLERGHFDLRHSKYRRSMFVDESMETLRRAADYTDNLRASAAMTKPSPAAVPKRLALYQSNADFSSLHRDPPRHP